MGSQSLTARVAQKYLVRHARDRHNVLTQFKAKRLWVLNDLVSVFRVIGSRLRAAHERRILGCDPLSRSEAWPKLQQSRQDQEKMEQEVAIRKERLRNMEKSDDPDQVGHIRALLQDV